VNNGLECGNIWSLAVNRASGEIFAGTAGCGTGVYRSTDNGDSWALANTGLTSTDIAGLGINNNGHIFAATRSIMGQGGGIFRSTDNGDSWTEQNNGFTAFDANGVAFNSAGHVFAAAAGGVFRSTNDGASWSDVSTGLIPAGGNVWTVAIDSGNYAFAGTAGAGVFRSTQSTVAVRNIPKPRPRPTPPPRP
jgi:photosystem II stability/assembly factor-like uncharacterized protein